jgi:hypothetical protein
LNLVQFLDDEGDRQVGVVSDGGLALSVIGGEGGLYRLALEAIERGVDLETLIQGRPTGEKVDYRQVIDEMRLLPPIDHPDPAHLLITGTGLTHLGSADARDEMHKKTAATSEAEMSDSMKMFMMGLEGGKPIDGSVGIQPEWFYKGDGSVLVAPGHPFDMPAFALDGGEEPEIVGIYLIGADGAPRRVGFALGNEFSDHVLEKENYLYLAHSKLRQCSVGPELRTGDLPQSVSGLVRVARNGEVVWEDTWLSGEANMSHYIAGLEYHHFKYDLFRRPGDVHIHFFGTAVLSFTAGVEVEVGDVFEISAEGFGEPLINPLRRAADRPDVVVRSL